MDQAFIRQMQKKMEEQMTRKEKEVLQYWRTETDKIIKRRHRDLAGLSTDLKTLLDRMDRRLTQL